MLEAYQAFGDYATMMETVESLITTVAQKVLGTLMIPRSQSGAIAAAIDKAVKTLDEISGEGFSEILRQRTDLENEGFQKSIKALRDHLWELRNNLGVKSNLEIAKDAYDTISKWAAEISAVHIPSKILGDTEKYNQALIRITQKIAEATKWPAFALKIEIDNPEINLGEWRRLKYSDLICAFTGKDWYQISPAERRQRAHDMGAEIGKEFEDFEVTNAVFSKFVEPTLIQPTFVTHLPKELVPLAKLSPDDPTTVEVFECCINGQEISPGYTEQNDPIAQRATLEHQAGGEQQKLDEDFLVALEHGMPPAGGIGIGIDRLCMMLLGQESIRDVILFPQLKPK
jgi:lysyl-tRNA synthetase class II